MKKTIRLTDAKLNSIISKVLREQNDEQYMNGVDQEKMSGSPEGETSEPDYEEFTSCAQKLLSQGITIGNLVDKLLESQKGGEETEPETEEMPEEPQA